MNIILLHGALGTSHQLLSITAHLSAYHKTFSFNFIQHGGTPSGELHFSIQGFADQLLSFMDNNNLANAALFGYSLGGYVALYTAIHQPDRITKIATLATKIDWNAAFAQKMVADLDPELILERYPPFAEKLIKLHSEEKWKTL
ncbi:MAG: alpha/beta hydrolase, partial [Chitinophagia bacterium]|nr:alpha/beta hydrolase [Chitinophagia bacterium]